MPAPGGVDQLGEQVGATLAACGGSGGKATVPTYTGSASPSTTATIAPDTTTLAPGGLVALVAHSTHAYGGLNVVVNLPANMPKTSFPE